MCLQLSLFFPLFKTRVVYFLSLTLLAIKIQLGSGCGKIVNKSNWV